MDFIVGVGVAFGVGDTDGAVVALGSTVMVSVGSGGTSVVVGVGVITLVAGWQVLNNTLPAISRQKRKMDRLLFIIIPPCTYYL